MVGKLGVNLDTHCAMPRCDPTSEVLVGRGAFVIDSIFFGSARIPCAPKT